MHSLATIIGFFAATVLPACGQASYSIAPTESMATTLKFNKPASLLARTGSQSNSELDQIFGKPVSEFYFGDSEASEYSYSILIFPVGSAFGAKRDEFVDKMNAAKRKVEKRNSKEPPPIGTHLEGDRSVLYFPLGFGAGGESMGVLFPHRTEPIEIVVIQHIDYREPPYPQNKRPDATPSIKFYEALDQIEAMISVK